MKHVGFLFLLGSLTLLAPRAGAETPERADTLTVPAPMATDVRELLIGETPGVVAVSSMGKPGMTPSVYIRGIHPFQQNPAFYVDGVQVIDLGFLAPESIEKIEVLSGAEAVQRFGPAAACRRG